MCKRSLWVSEVAGKHPVSCILQKDLNFKFIYEQHRLDEPSITGGQSLEGVWLGVEEEAGHSFVQAVFFRSILCAILVFALQLIAV